MSSNAKGAVVNGSIDMITYEMIYAALERQNKKAGKQTITNGWADWA